MEIEELTRRTSNQLKRLFWAHDLGELNIETLRRELEKGFPVKNIGDLSVKEIEELTGYTLDFVDDVLLDPLNIGVVSRYRVLKKVERRKDKNPRMDTFIYKWLADKFEHPCNYAFDGEEAVDVIDPDCNYCQEVCGQPVEECWHRYFRKLKEAYDAKVQQGEV